MVELALVCLLEEGQRALPRIPTLYACRIPRADKRGKVDLNFDDAVRRLARTLEWLQVGLLFV